MKNFKVIGQYNKMQTVSWDQETILWDGIPYNIAFFQDFSKLYLDGLRIIDIPVSAIIQAVIIQPDKISENSAVYLSGEDYRRSQELRKCLKKHEKNEKKWKKEHSRSKNPKEALRNFEYIVDKLMEG